jgi:hypothetical protein
MHPCDCMMVLAAWLVGVGGGGGEGGGSDPNKNSHARLLNVLFSPNGSSDWCGVGGVRMMLALLNFEERKDKNTTIMTPS